jgi:hypothetical protein
MKKKRIAKLHLRRETLRELDERQERKAAGGSNVQSCSWPDDCCPTRRLTCTTA